MIDAALTPDEWKRWQAKGRNDLAETTLGRPAYFAILSDSGRATGLSPEGRHIMAAICLYEQPFGFTRAEWKALAMRDDDMRPEDQALATLALAKIASLLPPE